MAQFQDKWGKATAKARYGTSNQSISTRDTGECNPQFKEDQHGPKYDNDTSGWVAGKGKDPHFKPGP